MHASLRGKQDLQLHNNIKPVCVCVCTNSSGGCFVRMTPKTSDPWEEKEGMKMIYVFHWTTPYAHHKSTHKNMCTHTDNKGLLTSRSGSRQIL